MAEGPIQRLQDWYANNCDGDWEHQYGVEIGTLDNPGWRLKVDVVGTALEGLTQDRHVVERTQDDWLQAWCDGSTFNVAAGPRNLIEAVATFWAFVEAHDA